MEEEIGSESALYDEGIEAPARPSVDMAGYRSLYVWQEGKALAVDIYLLTQDPPFAEDGSFRDQLRRTAVRIPSNIAEADERATPRERLRFLYTAKASLAKLRTQLEIAYEIRYIADNVMERLSTRCQKLERMLGGLIRSRTAVL